MNRNRREEITFALQDIRPITPAQNQQGIAQLQRHVGNTHTARAAFAPDSDDTQIEFFAELKGAQRLAHGVRTRRQHYFKEHNPIGGELIEAAGLLI